MTWASLFSILPIACIGLILAASLHDIVARTIPNRLVLALAVAAAGNEAINGNLSGSLFAAGGVFIVAALCWRRGWLGGGDVKLLGAAALGVPAHSVLVFVAAMAIAGGGLALVYLAARPFVTSRNSPRPENLVGRVIRVEGWRIARGGPLPYACAIAAGFLFAVT
jgi:prepilin peptidase CpaA